MESNNHRQPLNFEKLSGRLLAFVETRVQNGDFTERGLARILGVSQPQIHNVLKGSRKLQPALADRILLKFGLSLLDLIDDAELRKGLVTRPMHTSLARHSSSPSQLQQIDPELEDLAG